MTTSRAPWNKPTPISHSPMYVGKGRYIAFAEWFACLDDRESMWRLSRVTLDAPRSMQFEYIGTFATEQEVLTYINTEANA